MPNICAIYARYSNLDELTKTGESRSITNQIEALTEYAINNNFNIYKIYSDHHYSGMNFNRPGIAELLEDAENNKFNIILVKDLSRFGRNYIEVGKYLEVILPKYNIRLISINDNFDSSKATDNIIIAFKNILNTMYVKDIKRKINKAIKLKMETEPLTSKKYGYNIKDKEITIYEPEAKIIKRIYSMYLKGIPLRKIKEQLIEEKIYSPGISHFYKINKEVPKIYKNKYNWSIRDLRTILSDVFYIGDAINNKNGDAKCTDMGPKYFKDHHIPIIDRNTFNKIDRKGLVSINMEARDNNLTRMIYCVKCICRFNYDKSRACLAPIEVEGRQYYCDYQCDIRYPVDLMNQRIYQELKLKYNHILSNKEKYINDILLELNSINNDSIKIEERRTACEKQIQKYLESYTNLKITYEEYLNYTESYRKEIIKCNNYLKTITYNEDEIRNVNIKVNKFLNEFDPNDTNIVDVIKQHCHMVLYDNRFGKIIIILKLESDLNLPSVELKNIIIPYKLKNADFELKEMILEYLKYNHHKKLNDMLEEFKKTWDGFTYSMIKKAIQALEHENKVEIEGRSYICDTYHLVGEPDDFDYKGMKISRRHKEVYKLLYMDQTLNYKQIAEKLGISESTVRSHVIDLRNKGAFNDPHFDKTIIQEGSLNSIFEDMYMTSDEEEPIIEYIKVNPRVSGRELTNIFNIRLGSAKRLLQKYRG